MIRLCQRPTRALPAFPGLPMAAAGLLVALSATAAAAQAVRPPTYVPGVLGVPQPEPTVTVDMKGRSLNSILYEIFKQVPLKYAVRAEVGTTVCTLKAEKLPVTQALNQLLAQDKRKAEPLVWSFQKNPAGGGTFVIDREFIEVGMIEGENRVSLSNGRLTKVLPMIFNLMHAKYRIEPDVPPVPLSLQLRPSVWHQALPQVILEAFKTEPGLTYSIDGDTYVVHLQKAPPLPRSVSEADSPMFRKVHLSVDNEPLRDVLAKLMAGSQWKYQVSPAVKDVRVTFASEQPELAALAALLRQASATSSAQQLTYREGPGVLFIELGPLPGEQVANSRELVVGPTPVTMKVSLRIKPLVEELASRTGTTIVVAMSIPPLPVDIDVKNATVEDVLKEIIKKLKSSLPNVRYRSTGPNAYIIDLGAP